MLPEGGLFGIRCAKSEGKRVCIGTGSGRRTSRRFLVKCGYFKVGFRVGSVALV